MVLHRNINIVFMSLNNYNPDNTVSELCLTQLLSLPPTVMRVWWELSRVGHKNDSEVTMR